jgi:hypothetical protein
MSTDTPWATPVPSPGPDDGSLPKRPRRASVGEDAIAFAVVTAAGVLLAFGVGALWRAFAPAVLAVVEQGGVYYAAPEGKTFIARDGWFAAFACLAAVLLALFAFLRHRRVGGLGAALALAVGGIAGGYLAAWFAAVVGPGGGSIPAAAHGVPDGSSFELPMSLRATGVIWLWPAVAVGLFFFLMLLFGPAEPEHDAPGFPGWGEPREGEAAHPGQTPAPFPGRIDGSAQTAAGEPAPARPDQLPD